MVPAKPRPFARFDLRRAWLRVLVPLAVGVLVAWLVGDIGFRRRLIVGWDAAATLLLAFSWFILLRADAAETKRRASIEDPGRAAVGLITLVASAVSFFAAVSLMADPTAGAHGDTAVWTAPCLGAVLSAWLVTHTTWTFRYAHLYYESAKEPPLEFPGHETPCDMDFAYFAFTLGMSFQVSDVSIRSSRMRRTTLFHTLLSFLYNTGILAVAINLATGRLA